MITKKRAHGDRGDTEKKDVGGGGCIDTLTPWGEYVPPSPGRGAHQGHDATVTRGGCEKGHAGDALPLLRAPHGGYVRLVDAKGKHFPCAFSRQIGRVVETVAVAAGDERRPSLASGLGCEDGKEDPPAPTIEATARQRTTTIAEERLHPEEALFLHMRGLLRIEKHPGRDPPQRNQAAAADATLSTQELFCEMLPECNIPLAAYMAYAHLRAQGYVLVRYTDRRIGLLCRRMELERVAEREREEGSNPSSTVAEGGRGSDESPSVSVEEIKSNEICHTMSQNGETKHVDDTASNVRIRTCPLRIQLSDDAATAPPPHIMTLGRDGSAGEPEIRLAYYAYNPNSRFKRSNPGLPDFGVAVLPYRSGNSEGPTFDVLRSLVSLCEGRECSDLEKDSSNSHGGIPLRVITVADGGAVLVFGVTHGDVPCT